MAAEERRERVAEEIKRTISDILRKDTRDPALSGMLSVVAVDVSRDMRVAKVRVSLLADDAKQQEAIRALEHAAGFIRREVGQRIRLRFTPEIRFELDTGIAYSVHISKLIQSVKPKEEDALLPDGGSEE